METKARQSRRWPCLEFSLVDVHKPEAVAEFIIWLCTGHYRDDWKDPDASSREIDEEDLVETLWSWDNAPRQRMAKLLWQLLVGNDSSEHFSQFFTIDEVWLTRQAKDCQKILGRIHKKLRWVLDGFMERKQQDVSIGQSRWGEEWLLPPKHTAMSRSDYVVPTRIFFRNLRAMRIHLVTLRAHILNKHAVTTIVIILANVTSNGTFAFGSKIAWGRSIPLNTRLFPSGTNLVPTLPGDIAVVGLRISHIASWLMPRTAIWRLLNA
jgi:hypothetical protein